MKYFYFLPYSLVAQQNSLTGKVLDRNSNNALEFTTVSLLKLPDSTLVIVINADMHGNFDIKATGDYLLRFAFMGYETLFRNIGMVDYKLDPGSVRFKGDGEFLKEVTITAAKQLCKNFTELIVLSSGLFFRVKLNERCIENFRSTKRSRYFFPFRYRYKKKNST